MSDTPEAHATPSAAPDSEAIGQALDVVGLRFDARALELMAAKVGGHRDAFNRLRAAPIPEGTPPALPLDPRPPAVRRRLPRVPAGAVQLPDPAALPTDPGTLACASITHLAALVRSRRVSCVELATIALDRLRAVDPVLHCVVTLTAERALAQARRLDAELAAGRWRGPLHGIPWGAKDLLSVAGYPTTWGTPPLARQRFEEDAAVVELLDAAGAVLVAKLSLGELAWGDVWTGGRTNNPWDPSEGSSGSSAGSAAAVAAGAVPFAIGSETLGSIMSPARACGITGLRPTFGRVSRHGAMALSWSLDKLGPMTRSAEDAAIVLAAIVGRDERDESTVDAPFGHPAPVDPSGWRIGVVETAFERQPEVRGALDELRSFGCELVPVELPAAPIDDLWLIGEAEAATAFDDFLRSGRDREMVRQEDDAWPNVFKAARLIPAVEYLRAGRLRRRLQIETGALMADLDLLVHPADEDTTLTLENLTGHPAIALPWGSRPNGAPDSIALAGHLDGEQDLLGFAVAWQARTEHHRNRPPI
jgi:Asp-tRNA(Asn)/Glu-tRNA(Gln) amidotransferase A subunit family amidase